jgi:aminodeoxyfutalosine synthase
LSFIPLAYQPGQTGLAFQTPTVLDDLKLLAISRLYLDNFPHIKAYWVTLGEQTASMGLHFGADDVDGTLGDERIMHAAGVESPSGLVRQRLEKLISDAGCVPVERDAVYNIIEPEHRRTGVPETASAGILPASPAPRFIDAGAGS